MASKRNRVAIEAELQAAQSPFVFYGTPLPPIDPNVRDDGSYVPEWEQEVRDERGRKRLHGAFTGGWSAGYFNTVGSKEGWTPQAFVSSRSKKAEQTKPAAQRPEDFMDDEDLADAAESRMVQTAAAFAALGTAETQADRSEHFMDLVRPANDSVGVKLLQKMGWRPGQGIGPKVRRKAREDDNDLEAGDDQQTYLFAPDDVKMITLVQKNDVKGLGFGASKPLPHLSKSGKTPTKSSLKTRTRTAAKLSFSAELDEGEEGLSIIPKSRTKANDGARPAGRRRLGTSVTNDNGYGEDEMDRETEYNNTIEGEDSIEEPAVRKPASRLAAMKNKDKPPSATTTLTEIRKCHDGRPALDGFVLSSEPAPVFKVYAPPIIPAGWKNFRDLPSTSTASAEWQSTADAAKTSTLNPSARANILGEQALPGRSVFDFLTPEARARLVAATGRNDLPPAKGLTIPGSKPLTEHEQAQQLWQMVPPLAKDLALAAISRGYSGFMPYAEDEAKRVRYRAFLELKAGLKSNVPERKAGHSMGDWRKELYEFAQAAEVFKPMTGLMASRFTSSTKVYEGGDSDRKAGSSPPAPKQEDPAEAAARMGMYGPMTRSVQTFYPMRLVCKRFGVKPPAHVVTDPGEVGGGAAASTAAQELVSKSAMEKMMREASWHRRPTAAAADGSEPAEMLRPQQPAEERAAVDVETNEALEKERPGDDVFAAIFGDDSDEE